MPKHTFTHSHMETFVEILFIFYPQSGEQDRKITWKRLLLGVQIQYFRSTIKGRRSVGLVSLDIHVRLCESEKYSECFPQHRRAV